MKDEEEISTAPEETPVDTENQKQDEPHVSQGEEESYLTYRFGNLQGIGTRENQEDAFAFSNIFDREISRKKGVLAVVADGMGGLKGGKLSADTAVSTIRQGFSSFDFDGDIPEQLNSAVHRAGKKVADAVGGRGGCTAVATVISRDRLFFSSVGDSFIILKRGELLTKLNRSQNVITDVLADLVSCGSVNPKDAWTDDRPEALTQFLGKEPIDEIDYLRKPLKLRFGDVILLCSDGVAGTLTEDVIFHCLELETPAEMCAALESAIVSKQRRYQDNYTALVLQCVYS